MIVAVDAGNSALKVARARESAVSHVARAAVSRDADVAERISLAQPLIRDAAEAGAEVVMLVSVVPAWTAAVAAIAGALEMPLLHATPSTIPLPVRLRAPDGVGADRLVDAYAAAQLHGVPVIVVDLGTATTVDLVDESGAFRGGAILVGVELGARALANGTALLPDVGVDRIPSGLGTNTLEAMSSGLLLGHLGAVREVVERITRDARLPGRPRVIVTGGASRAAWSRAWTDSAPGLPPIADVVDPDLTLRGLGLLGARLAAAAGRA
jgi:type III pantothenate kinase